VGNLDTITDPAPQIRGRERSISPLPGISREISDSKTFRQHLLNLGFMETRNSGALDPPALPGVGTFFAEPPATSLPKGFAMSWVTVRLGRAER